MSDSGQVAAAPEGGSTSVQPGAPQRASFSSEPAQTESTGPSAAEVATREADGPTASNVAENNGFPDWIAEKYRGADNPMEAQAKAYHEAIKKLTVKTDDLKAEIETGLRDDIRAEVEAELNQAQGLPADIDGYEYPEGITPPEAEGVDTSFREWALKNKVSPEAFQELVGIYGKTMPDMSAEIEKLGPNAESRIKRLNEWGTKNIPQELHGAVEKMLTSAEAVEVFEMFMNGERSAGFSPAGGEPAKALTRDQIRRAQSDPRYWDPTKRDNSYVQEVNRMWDEFAKRNPR